MLRDSISRGLVASCVALLIAGCDRQTTAPPQAGSPGFATVSGATQNLTIPVSFTIPGGTCGLTTTVTGDGLFHIVTRTTEGGNGAWHVGFSWSAHGTATGADGSSYRFNYAINAKSVDPTGPDDLVTIVLVDHFNLLGQRQAPDLKVYLHGSFEFPAFTPIGDAVIRGPSISCDPI